MSVVSPPILGDSPSKTDRESWIDLAKLVACILVALGHLVQSFGKVGFFDPSHMSFRFFNQTIYLFHVQVFFFCSGYLHQRLAASRVAGWHRKHLPRKALDLVVPYLVFSSITLALKSAFPGSANTISSPSAIHSLLFEPIAPYWYLHALLILLVVFPPAAGRTRMVLTLVLALGLVATAMAKLFPIPFPLHAAVSNAPWFALGMAAKEWGWLREPRKALAFASLAFIPLAGAIFRLGPVPRVATFFATSLGIAMIVLWSGRLVKAFSVDSKPFRYLCERTMPIFLLHTICAAGLRSILFKAGVDGFWPHLAAGLVGSFALPALVWSVALRFPAMRFFFQPSQVLRSNSTSSTNAAIPSRNP